MLDTHPILQKQGTHDDGLVGYTQVLLVISVVVVGLSWFLAKGGFVSTALWILWLSGWLLGLLCCVPLKRLLKRLFMFTSKGASFFLGGVIAAGCLVGAITLPVYVYATLARTAPMGLFAGIESSSDARLTNDLRRSITETQQKIEQFNLRSASLQKLLSQAKQERDANVKKLREMGINSSSDLQSNVTAKQYANSLRKNATDIEKLQRDIARFDAAITQANGVLRRLVRADAIQDGSLDRDLTEFTQQSMELDELLDGESTVIDDPIQQSEILDRELQRTNGQ